MSGTMTEQIIAEHAGREVTSGESVTVGVDKVLLQDGTGPLAVRQLRELDLEQCAIPDGTVIFLDHQAPPMNAAMANEHALLRSFAETVGCRVSEIGDGVCHQLMTYDDTAPGDILVGADSHTVTGGALGALATGMGSSDVAIALALGETWLHVPEASYFHLTGEFQAGVYAKDLILKIIGDRGADGENYRAMEFGGDAVERLRIDERMTIANMAVEAGAKCGIFPSDERTSGFLDKRGRRGDWRPLAPDDDADYDSRFSYDLSELEPQVAYPHHVDNVVPITDDRVDGVDIHQAFLGSCTNARYEDLLIAAGIIEANGYELHPRVRLIVNPASREVYQEAMYDGLIDVFSKAGASINPAGCGICYGGHQGALADGENAIGTNNRNFQGRFGNPAANVYLGSPATVAASAIVGELTDPREVLST